MTGDRTPVERLATRLIELAAADVSVAEAVSVMERHVADGLQPQRASRAARVASCVAPEFATYLDQCARVALTLPTGNPA